MASKETSASSNASEGFSLMNELKRLNASQTSYRKESGWFATNGQLKQIEDSVHRLMESGETSKSPTQLIEMQSTIDSLRQRASRAEEQLKASRANEAVQKADLATAKSSLAAAERESAASKGQISTLQQEARTELKALQAKLKRSSQMASDPDEVTKLKDQVADLQHKLAELNAEYKTQVAGVNQWHAKVKDLEAQVELEKAKRDRIARATIGPDMATVAPEPMEDLAFDPERDSAILKRVLSADSLALVKEAAEAQRESTREYAYKLMQLASHTDPRNFVGYRAYTKVLFDKVKSTSAKKREKYQPVLDSIFKSLAFEGGPKLKEVKKEFSDFFTVSPEQRETEKQKVVEGKATFWESLKYDLWFARAKVRHWFRSSKEKSLTWSQWLHDKWLKVPSLKGIFWWSSA
nr:MAG: hypothetical protein [Fusariviridae sp.]WAK72338.1 MAG: hypothetical protein [Fusariviridae sp.]